MRGFPFLAATVLVFAGASLSRAQQAPRPAQANQSRKIWTDDDMDALRARGLISIVGQEIEAAPQALAAPPQPAPAAAQPAPATAAAPEAPAAAVEPGPQAAVPAPPATAADQGTPAAAPEPGPQAAASAPTAPPEAGAQPTASAEEAATYDRTQDPRWYSEESANLQAQLDAAEADLAQAQQALAQVSSRIMAAGIDVNQRGLGVTPQAGIDILAARVREIQSQLDDLGDLARQNDIAPGDLRG
jgi:hypothetical protein